MYHIYYNTHHISTANADTVYRFHIHTYTYYANRVSYFNSASNKGVFNIITRVKDNFSP